MALRECFLEDILTFYFWTFLRDDHLEKPFDTFWYHFWHLGTTTLLINIKG